MNIVAYKCVVAVVGVCFSTTVEVNAVADALSRRATIHAGIVNLEVIGKRDDVYYPDRSKMSKECEGEDCIYYHKFCSVDDNIYQCTINLSEKGDDFNRIITIEGPDAGSVSMFLATMHIVADSGSLLYPLSKFDETSSVEEAPICRADSRRDCEGTGKR